LNNSVIAKDKDSRLGYFFTFLQTLNEP